MFEHKILQSLDEYFLDLSRRNGRGVYFYRINGYSEGIKAFLQKYFEAARLSGVIIEGRIPNPDEKNLEYYSEIMGTDFRPDKAFINESLRKWLPRMDETQRAGVSAAMYDTLDRMRREGKNVNMLKNAYTKFMCWLYYKFERIVNQLGRDKLPKVLYEGEVGNYELKLLTILSGAGCDVLLLQCRGDGAYLKLDGGSVFSTAYPMNGLGSFPDNFSLRELRREWEESSRLQQVYGPAPSLINCTNAWIEGKWVQDLLKTAQTRGEDPGLFYNCFFQITGVEDKLDYMDGLHRLYLQMKNAGRRVLTVNRGIPRPSVEEIAQIKRSACSNMEQLARELTANILYAPSNELQRLMRKAFLDLLLEEGRKNGMNLNRLTNKGVYLLCWLKRYQQELFGNWKPPEVSCFIYLGGCGDEEESLFVRLLSRLPADVLLLVPDRKIRHPVEDGFLYEVNYPEAMEAERFPGSGADVQIGTTAYHAERELDTLMYQDSGMYRPKQCDRAAAVVLKTMYEEIYLLWDEEMNFRPGFSVVEGLVNIPVILAKVSGVKDGDVERYWADIKKLITEDTYVVKKVPFIGPSDPNPMKQYAVEFLKNGKLLKNKIKGHKSYPYGVLREEIQEHLLDKLQLLLDQRTVRGTYENGTEYTVIATVLNLDKALVRLIQKFDFTRKNPKLIYINTTDSPISLEDSILTAYLSLLGFDVVFFIPTGYLTVEKHFQQRFAEEHQIGDYVYDLTIPDFTRVTAGGRRSWRDKIFKRGG